jgi:putative restriction endonuclease
VSRRLFHGQSTPVWRCEPPPGPTAGTGAGAPVLPVAVERAGEDAQPQRVPPSWRQVGRAGWCKLRDETAHFSRIYRILIGAARAEAIGSDQLPDFLGLGNGGELALLGQEELNLSVVEEAMRDVITRITAEGDWKERDTEQIVLGAVRVGQHVFARNVIANCGGRCVFCGFMSPPAPDGKRILLAGHIKPWKDSSPRERLDARNGLAACPAHDAAFDKGMITVNGGLRIHLARSLADAVQADTLARQFYGRPPLREVLLFPPGAQMPARKYLDWHREKVFVR